MGLLNKHFSLPPLLLFYLSHSSQTFSFPPPSVPPMASHLLGIITYQGQEEEEEEEEGEKSAFFVCFGALFLNVPSPPPPLATVESECSRAIG